MEEDPEVQTPPEGIGLAEGAQAAEGRPAELPINDAEARLQRLPGWSLVDEAKAVESTFSFAGPGDALAAVAFVAGTARARGWRVTLELSECEVRVQFRSTGTGRISAAELSTAREVSRTLQRLGAESASR